MQANGVVARTPRDIATERATEAFKLVIVPLLAVAGAPAFLALQADFTACGVHPNACVIHWQVALWAALSALAGGVATALGNYVLASKTATNNVQQTGTTAPAQTLAGTSTSFMDSGQKVITPTSPSPLSFVPSSRDVGPMPVPATITFPDDTKALPVVPPAT